MFILLTRVPKIYWAFSYWLN